MPNFPQRQTGDTAKSIPTLEFAGFFLFFTWCFFALFQMPSDLVKALAIAPYALTLEVVGLGGLVSILVIFDICADTLTLPRKGLLILSALPLAAGVAMELLQAHSPVLYFPLAFLGGASTGIIFLCWYSHIGRYPAAMTMPPFVLAQGLAVLIGYLISGIPSPYDVIVALACLLASCLILYLSFPRMAVIKDVNKTISRKRRPMQWKTHILFCLFGVCLGVTLYVIAQFHMILLVTIAVIIGLLGALADAWYTGGVYPDRMKRILVVVFVIGLSLIPALPPIGHMICGAVFTACLAYFFAVQLNWTSYSVQKFKLNTISFISEAQIPIFMGMLLGCLLGCIFNFLGLKIAYFATVLIPLLVLGFALFTPKDLEILAFMPIGEEGAEESDEPVEHENDERPRRYFNRCSEIAKIYNLTPRESEILRLLGKGNHAEHISSLLVISKHTTKTHIYHIYQKLGINSQQALIDMIDSLAGPEDSLR